MIVSMWADFEEKQGVHFVAQEYCLPEVLNPETLEPMAWRGVREWRERWSTQPLAANALLSSVTERESG
jgi:hypothetical protein